MSSDYKVGVVIADWHVGHACGMMPRGFRSSTGSVLNLNAGQEYLLQCYEHALSVIPRELDFLVLNGDMGEGQQPAEECRMLSEVDPSFQARAAAELIDRLASRVRGGRVYATRGSRYHTGRGGRLDEEIARMVGAVPDAAGHHARAWLLFDVDGVRISCHHHQSVVSRYRSMPVEREIGFALEFCGRTGERMPDLFIASHAHWGYGAWYDGSGFVSVSTPAMKLQDNFAAGGRMPWRWRPERLGMLVVKVYSEPVDGFRVHLAPLLYDHPPLGVEAG